MTLNTEERERLRRALDVYAGEAPPAPNWGSWETTWETKSVRRPRRRLNGPLVAVTAAALVIVVFGGVAVLQRWAGPDTTTTSPQSVETWGDWYEWAVSGGELNGRDPTILQGGLGPEAQFDPNGLGIEQALEPVSQVVGEVPWSVLVGDPQELTDRGTLLVAGRAESSIAAVVGGMFEGEQGNVTDGVCLIVARPDISGDWASAATCRDQTGPVAYDNTTGSPILEVDLSVDPSSSIAMAISPQTSVVALKSGSQQYWQRPRGGLVLFVGDFTQETQFTFYADSGEVLGQWSGRIGP